MRNVWWLILFIFLSCFYVRYIFKLESLVVSGFWLVEVCNRLFFFIGILRGCFLIISLVCFLSIKDYIL